MQDQAISPTSVNRAPRSTDHTTMIRSLLTMDTKEKVQEKLNPLSARDLISFLQITFELFNSEIQRQYSILANESEPVSALGVENIMAAFIPVLDSSISLLFRRIEDAPGFEDTSFIFNNPTFIHQTLTNLFGAMTFFRDTGTISSVVKLLNRAIHLTWSKSKIRLFSETEIDRFYKEFFRKSTSLSPSITFTNIQVLKKMLYILDSVNFEPRVKICIIGVIRKFDQNIIHKCLSETEGLALFLDVIYNAISLLSYRQKPTLSDPSPRILQRAFFKMAKSPPNENLLKSDDINGKDNILEILIYETLHLVHNAIFYYQILYNPSLSQSFYLDKLMNLFDLMCSVHFDLTSRGLLTLNNRFIKHISMPVLRLMVQLFQIYSGHQYNTPPNLERLFEDKLTPLINYCLLAIGLLGTRLNYSLFQRSLGSTQSVDHDNVWFFALLTQLLRCFTQKRLEMNTQHKLIIFEMSMILMQAALHYMPTVPPDNLLIAHDFYTIFNEFYQRLEDSQRPMHLPVKPLQSIKKRLLLQLQAIISSLMDDDSETSLNKYKLSHFRGTASEFFPYYQSYATFALLLIQYKGMLRELDLLGSLPQIVSSYSAQCAQEEFFLYELKFPELLEESSMVFRDICLSFCSGQGPYSDLFWDGNDLVKLIMVKSAFKVCKGIISKSRLVSLSMKIGLVDLPLNFKLYPNQPKKYHVEGIKAMFNFFEGAFSNTSFRTYYLENCFPAHLITLLGHAFLLWAGHPRVLPRTQTSGFIIGTSDGIAMYESYGREVLVRILVLMKQFDHEDVWQSRFVHSPDKHVPVTVPPAAESHLKTLIHLPANLMPLTNSSGPKVLTMIPTLFNIVMAWKHCSDLGYLSAARLQQLTKLPTCMRFVLNSSDYVGRLAYQTTITYYRDTRLNNYITYMISKILLNSEHMKIMLLRDRIGEWYRNILRLPDYATFSKLTDPNKLTLPIQREITRIGPNIIDIFRETLDSQSKAKLYECSAVGLCYCSTNDDVKVDFVGSSELHSFERFDQIDWVSSLAPFGAVIRMLFGCVDPDDVTSRCPDRPPSNASLLKLDDIRNRSAAYAINYHAFLKTTPLRRKMKAELREAIAMQFTLITPIFAEFSEAVNKGNPDSVLFVCEDSHSCSVSLEIPTCFVRSMSPAFAEMLDAGGMETSEDKITLPHHHYASLFYLANRMRSILENQRRKPPSTKLEFNFLGDTLRYRQPAKLKGLMELAETYNIEFLRQYCIGTLIRHLFAAGRYPNRAQSLHVFYELFAENDQFPLFRKTPDLSRFLCHLIGLHLISFFQSPAPNQQHHRGTVPIRRPTQLKRPREDEELSSDVSDSDEQNEINGNNRDPISSSESDSSDIQDNPKPPISETLPPYLHSLNPSLMARWWADLYFKP